MDTVEVSTEVFLPPEEVYEFLLDFPRYARYSEYLKEVRQYGDGSPGTEYELDFAWWRLGYTARSEVTDVAEPERIDWRVVKDVDAVGCWVVEPLDETDLEEATSERLAAVAPDDRDPDDPVTRVTMRVSYAPDSAGERMVDLPRFVSLDWVVRMVKPKIQSEAERVVRRIVADLEGAEREVYLDIETS